MNPLAVPTFLAVVERVLVARHHLLLAWHLGVPPRQRAVGLVAVVGERASDGGDDRVDGPEPRPLPRLGRR